MSNEERSIARATWATAIAALLSFVATMVLAAVSFYQSNLALRQEQATYDANLLTKQIEYMSDLLARLGHGGNSLPSGPVDRAWARKQSDEAFAQEFQLRRSAELVRLVSPKPLQSVMDNVVQTIDAKAHSWGILANDLNQILENSCRVDRLRNVMDEDNSWLWAVRKELDNCANQTIMNHAAINEISVRQCDLKVGQKSPTEKHIEEDNTPENRAKVTARFLHLQPPYGPSAPVSDPCP